MLCNFKIDANIPITPYCETMTDNYYYHVNSLGLKGVEDLVYPGKPDFVPYADAFLLRYKARRVDFITSARMNYFSAWLMTEKMLDVMLCFRLPEHNIYDAWVEHRKKRYPYKILHFWGSHEKFVDFQKSSFYIVDCLDKTKQKIYINNKKEYHLELNKLPLSYGIRTHDICFIEEDLINVDVFNMRYMTSGIFLKQNLVDALRASNITGIVFEPITIPIKRRIVWADTGLPVED